MKSIYEKLLKIKKPVLIEVWRSNNTDTPDRYRILYPNGRCEYAGILFDFTFDKSCFTSFYTANTLKNTVKKMKKYDEGWDLQIIKFEEI